MSSTLSPPLGRPGVVLHVWPKCHDALSFDVNSAAAILLCQLTIPGQFEVVYCANPDVSPTGQLPFLTHGLHHVSTLDSIIHYVRTIKGANGLDADLSQKHAAQMMARIAHVESVMGDLVAHMVYGLHENWANVTRPILASALSFPQRYYLPDRLRESYRPRLEAAELWDVPEPEEEEEKQRRVIFGKKKRKTELQADKFQHVFQRDRVSEKARAALDAYSTLLSTDAYFFNHRGPTTLDVVFASHIHVLISLPFKDRLVADLLEQSYPHLVQHCRRVTLPLEGANFWSQATSKGPSSLQRMTLFPRFLWPKNRARTVRQSTPEVQALERQYRLWRWGFVGLSTLMVTGYLLLPSTVALAKQIQNAYMAVSQELMRREAESLAEGSNGDGAGA